MTGPPRPASTSPSSQRVPHKIEQYLKSVLRPSSQMQYATQNSFRRLQRQKLDQDWFDHVREEAKHEQDERRKATDKRRAEKREGVEEVRNFYREKERSQEDVFLEKEAERIESQQWYEHNVRLERQQKQELLEKRAKEFQTFAEQARDFKLKQLKEKEERERQEAEVRKSTERGLAQDQTAERKRFVSKRSCFVEALKQGTEIARAHRAEEKKAEKEFATKLVAEAKLVLATEKERDAEEKERRLARVRKHEQLQQQAAQIYRNTVFVQNEQREKELEVRTSKEVEKVDEQYRQRRLGEKQKFVEMRKNLQSALNDTVLVHERQKEEERKEELRMKKMVMDAVKKEQLDSKKEVELRRQKRQKLKLQQEQDILRRNELLLQAPKLKITDKK